jgi:hypothetical protein
MLIEIVFEISKWHVAHENRLVFLILKAKSLGWVDHPANRTNIVFSLQAHYAKF